MICLILAIVSLSLLFMPSFIPNIGLGMAIILLIVSFVNILKTKKGIYYAALAFCLIAIIWYIIVLVLALNEQKQLRNDAKKLNFEIEIISYIADLEYLQLPQGKYECEKVTTLSYDAPESSKCFFDVDDNSKVTITLIGKGSNKNLCVQQATLDNVKAKTKCEI